MSILGNVAAAGQLSLQLLTIKPKRGFYASTDGAIIAQATVEEMHSDETEITEHPVEQGSTISDHAFSRPSEVIVTCGWSNSPSGNSPINALIGAAANASPVAQAIIGAVQFAGGIINLLNGGQDTITTAYNSLLSAQQNRILFDVYTGKRVYQNMLIKSVVQTTDQHTENSSLIRVSFRQILMAVTQTVTVPDSSVMANPEQNGSTVNMGTQSLLPSPTYNVNAAP
ncbi:phage baseplate protein [Paraburkholderia sp. BCC1885]|uniref:phage baseplate protein n=1 Tax=Paraburkholderia sp. BCC1885 TaxID=2562669 RepID=UPI001182E45E|nr:hypothetical protein [Paraburkholderia sp. BCC1885]